MQRTIGALLCACLLVSCSKTADVGGGSASGLHPWSKAGHLKIGIQRSPTTLNPILAGNTTESMINRLGFSLLTTVSADGKQTLPDLAADVPTEANGGISKDGLTITYKLRTGVKWHDGAPFSSKDVKFTWSAIMNDQNNVPSRTGYEDVETVDTPDEATVIFHLKHKFAPFVDTVFGESDDPMGILPEHLLGKLKDVNRIPFNNDPVGTGPFKVTRWIRNDHIELVANDDYFKGKPKLRTIEIKDIPNENTSVNALRTHDIDWIFEASPNLYNVLKSVPDVHILLNNQPQTLSVYINNSRPYLADVRVRQAIAYAIDKQALVTKTTGGSATVAQADQPPFSWAYEPNVATYPTSAAKAKALLAQAGYTPGPGGIMQKNGVPLAMNLSYNVENATRRLVAIQVQDMLKGIGIDASIKTYPADLLFANYGQGGILKTAKFDLNIGGWIAGIDPDDHALFGCDQFPPKGTNYFRYCSKAMDAAQKEALDTYDRAKRKIAYAKIQKILATDLPEIFIWYPRQLQPTNPDFKGFTPNPVNEAWNAFEWEI